MVEKVTALPRATLDRETVNPPMDGSALTVRATEAWAEAPRASVSVRMTVTGPGALGTHGRTDAFVPTQPGGRPDQVYAYGVVPPAGVVETVVVIPTSRVGGEARRGPSVGAGSTVSDAVSWAETP